MGVESLTKKIRCEVGSDQIYILDRNNRYLSGFNADICNLKILIPRKGCQLSLNKMRTVTCLIIFAITFASFQSWSQKDSSLVQVFTAPSLGTAEGLTVEFSLDYEPSGSEWALSFPESAVELALFETEYTADTEKSYQLRIGQGGQIYSLIAGFGESIPPQWRHPNWVQPSYGGGTSYAPWVDEVWQMVAVDEPLNNTPDSSYFIHQSGVYLKTPDQTSPFYSPVLASWFNEEEKSFTTINWGQQAHTEDLENIQFSSRLLYYTKYTCSYPGIIQVDQMMYNFGQDNMTFLNVPWGGVRHSSLGHTFLSAPDNTFEEIVGIYGNTPVIQAVNTGGWLAWSNQEDGNSSALAIANTISTVTNNNVIRYGDAGNLDAAWNDRDYSVLEMIRRPNSNQLKFGTGMKFRYFYVIDGSVSELAAVITDLNLEGEAFDTDFLPEMNDTDSLGFSFQVAGESLIKAQHTQGENDLFFKTQPFTNSYPVFEVCGAEGTSYITSDPNIYSHKPWDGSVASWELLGFREKSVSSSYEAVELCQGASLELPSGEIVTPTEDSLYTSLISGVDSTIDSLVFTHVNLSEPSLFFLDSDGDGYGDDTMMILDCELPAGYSEIDGDCDDSEASIYPDAPGSQEGLDNNCNGVIDPQEDPCFGDLNDDFSVDVSDLLILLNWAGCANNDCGADLNNDDSTTMADLLLFISFFGFQCD